MIDDVELKNLRIIAERCRENVMTMMAASGHGHLGGAFSSIDIITALYFYAMNIDPREPLKDDRDRFILSAGHKCMAQYAVLAEKGFFPKEILHTYGQLHTKIPGHPDMHKIPGIEANTGALGHGLSIACGMAIGLRLDQKRSKVFVVLGDGELAEGSNWEAASIASHYNLDNLVVFIDNNNLQISGKIQEVMNMTPIQDRFESFGWQSQTIDGNNMAEIIDALDQTQKTRGKPHVVIAQTIKSKGLTIGEGIASYHYWSPTNDEISSSIMEIRNRISSFQEKKQAVLK